MENRISQLFQRKRQNILNIYFTAGYPHLYSTGEVILHLEKNGVDIIEVGLPYSDPLADGPTIQRSATKALKNGMSTRLLFEQIEEVRTSTEIPLILMGNFNQILQYDPEKFFSDASISGFDGMIIPDLPMDVYQEEYKDLFDQLNLGISFLITPETSDDRIRKADDLSSAFLYVVSKSSITGKKEGLSQDQCQYFDRLNSLGLKSPRLIGFGIHDHSSFQSVCRYAHGAIIGSAFIRTLETEGETGEIIRDFIQMLSSG